MSFLGAAAPPHSGFPPTVLGCPLPLPCPFGPLSLLLPLPSPERANLHGRWAAGARSQGLLRDRHIADLAGLNLRGEARRLEQEMPRDPRVADAPLHQPTLHLVCEGLAEHAPYRRGRRSKLPKDERPACEPGKNGSTS